MSRPRPKAGRKWIIRSRGTIDRAREPEEKTKLLAVSDRLYFFFGFTTGIVSLAVVLGRRVASPVFTNRPLRASRTMVRVGLGLDMIVPLSMSKLIPARLWRGLVIWTGSATPRGGRKGHSSRRSGDSRT